MLLIITPPDVKSEWLSQLNALFASGLSLLHLRLPGRSYSDIEHVLQSIDPIYHARIVLCEHFDLLAHFDLGGIYLPVKRLNELSSIPIASHHILAVGAHSLEELKALSIQPHYALLSPVYDSISKKGYLANPNLLEIKEELRALPYPILALGGVTAKKQNFLMQAGYDGVALLGDIWSTPNQALSAFVQYSPPSFLSIAGHDPCSGAGITADHRVAQELGTYLYTIISCLTAQNAAHFSASYPSPTDYLSHSIKTLLSVHPVRVAKIGLLSGGLEECLQVVRELRANGVQWILWDPVFRPTAAAEVSESLEIDPHLRDQILSQINLITPNLSEAQQLWGTIEVEKLRRESLHTGCAILLKGGHDTKTPLRVTNTIIGPSGEFFYISHRFSRTIHGTGCMLSAAIAALITQGFTLPRAVEQACHYMDTLFRQGVSHLGHSIKDPRCVRRSFVSSYGSLQYITHRETCAEILYTAEKYLEGGGKWIQLRMKQATTEERISTGLALRALCDRYQAVLIIDDDLEATLAIGAHGVHLGKEDVPPHEARRRLGPNYIIGYTINSLEAIPGALSTDIDYIGIGPYRTTFTKDNLPPIIGLDGIVDISREVRRQLQNLHCEYLPRVVAIGGIVAEDIPSIKEQSDYIQGVAISGAIEHAEDISALTTQLLRELH